MNSQLTSSFDVPEGWGDDPLSAFETHGQQNRFKLFSERREWYSVLNDVAAELESISIYLASRLDDFPDIEGPLLFATARTQFLAAASMVSTGHALGAYAISRTVVESALYGWYLLVFPDAVARWRAKPTDKTARRVWGREFSFSAIVEKLRLYDETAASISQSLHQRAIDFGAHPNVNILAPNLHFVRRPDGMIEGGLAILHAHSGPWIDAFEMVAKSGAFAMLLFAYAFCEYEEGASTLRASFCHMEALARLLKDFEGTPTD